MNEIENLQLKDISNLDEIKSLWIEEIKFIESEDYENNCSNLTLGGARAAIKMGLQPSDFDLRGGAIWNCFESYADCLTEKAILERKDYFDNVKCICKKENVDYKNFIELVSFVEASQLDEFRLKGIDEIIKTIKNIKIVINFFKNGGSIKEDLDNLDFLDTSNINEIEFTLDFLYAVKKFIL